MRFVSFFLLFIVPLWSLAVYSIFFSKEEQNEFIDPGEEEDCGGEVQQ